MRWNEILNENNLAPLYHSIRNLEHAYMALTDNRLAATSTQRFWPDGKRRKDTDPEYEGSYWMKGISLTRNFNFAKNWGGMILVLDQVKLQQRYKIIPFNWGFSGKSTNHKKEFEEYLIIKATKDDYMRPEEYKGQEKHHRFDVKRFTSPEGYVTNLNQYIKGIYLDQITDEVYSDTASKNSFDKLEFIKNHPKFLGIVE